MEYEIPSVINYTPTIQQYDTGFAVIAPKKSNKSIKNNDYMVCSISIREEEIL